MLAEIDTTMCRAAIVGIIFLSDWCNKNGLPIVLFTPFGGIPNTSLEAVDLIYALS